MARAFLNQDPLRSAICRSSAASWDGVLERLFSLLFRGLVYPQIWEDPDLDLKALVLRPGENIVTIASGGCNVMSYLTADPAEVLAVDLNRAHVALTRLKLAAVQHLPRHRDFFRFFGRANEPVNIVAYHRFLKDRVDSDTRRYWEGRDFFGRQRITLFSRGLYRHGLLGRWIGMAHFVARLYGADPRELAALATLEEQRRYFDSVLAPLFERPLVRWATSQTISLYGLGIPPAQYEALLDGNGSMAAVLKTRLARLACGFPFSENYFAWQAFARCYPDGSAGPHPPYLQEKNFHAIRDRAQRVRVINGSLTEVLNAGSGSFDAFALLDSQDWMTDQDLNVLWTAITKSARPGARAVFRTSARRNLLPGRVAPSILKHWIYEAERSLSLGAEDRSAIYGGFHLYAFKG